MQNYKRKVEQFSSLRWDIHRVKELASCYEVLFKSNEDDFNALVKFESEFFATFQISITNDIVVRISRLLDRRKDVLSIPRFLSLYGDKRANSDLFRKLEDILAQAESVIRVRHEWIVHKNHEVALELKPLPEVLVSQLESAIRAIEDLFFDIRNAIFPNGVMDETGEERIFVRSDRARKFSKNLLEKIKRANLEPYKN